VLLLLSSFILHPSSVALGDGGALQYSQPCGEFRISVFTAPTPLRVGLADISVLVQDTATGKPRTEIPVEVMAHPVDKPQQVVQGAATLAAATNKLFRAVQLDLSESGRWHVEVVVTGAANPRRASFEVDVLEPPPAWIEYAAWIGWPFVAVLLFALHQYLKMRQRRGS
jgi:hypothetical protein